MAFGKNRKYKKVVKAIFPSTPGGEMQLSNISKLVYFCEMNPEQLQKVGPYIESKAEKNLSKKRLNYVTTCMIIVRELIIGCRKHLLFFSNNATRLMRLLLNESNHPDLQIEATETFIRFSSVQDDTTQIPPDLDEFIKFFINMAQNTNADDIKRRKLRGEGLKGISAYISISNLVDELDTFITKHTDIIYTILDNMQYKDQIPSPQYERNNTERDDENYSNLPTNVKSVATESLRDLARRVDNITVDSLVQSIVKYLDSHQKWNSDSFSIECLTSVSESIKPQHYSIMITSFIRHMELNHPPAVTRDMVYTSVAMVNENSSTSSINLIISSLVKLLINSIELSSTTQQPDIDEQLKLQSSIVESIGNIGKKSKISKNKIEIMILIMNNLRDITSNGKMNPRINNIIIIKLLQCILNVANTLNDISIQNSSSLNDISNKLNDLSKDPSTPFETRICIQKIFHAILLTGTGGGGVAKSYDQLINKGYIVSGTSDGVEEFLRENSTMIRDTLVNGFLFKSNQPDNIISQFKTMVIMLYRRRNKELQYSIPMIFQLQASATQKPQLSIRLARSIHLAIASYLLMVAKIYESAELDTYINEIIQKRKESGHNCRYLTFDGSTLIVSNSEKHIYKEKEKKEQQLEINDLLIDQDQVTQILCTISSLSSDFPDLKKTLSNKYTTNTSLTQNDHIELGKDEDLGIVKDNANATNTNSPATNTTQVVVTSVDNHVITTPPQMKIIPLLTKSSESHSIIPNTLSKSLNFDSFKQFTIAHDNDSSNNTTTGHHNNLSSINSVGSTNGTTNGISRERNSLTSNILLAKDLSFDYVSSKISEYESNNKEFNELMDILALSERQRQDKSIQKVLVDMVDVVPLRDNTSPSNNDELSSSCTLTMNIQSVLERVF